MAKGVYNDSKEVKELVKNTVNYLQNSFNSVCYKYRQNNNKAVNYVLRNSTDFSVLEESLNSDLTLYTKQVEFAYLMDEIQRGPVFAIHTNIKRANELIDELAEASTSDKE